MIECCNRLGFTLEPVPALFGGHLRWEDLEGYVSVELGILGDIHLAIPPSPSFSTTL